MEQDWSMERTRLLKRLGRMAFGRVNGAARLAVKGDKLTDEELARLDLTMLAEVKRGAGGAVEVKLVNRLEVIKLLLDELRRDTAETTGAAGFLAAMGEAAKTGGGDGA